MFRYPVPARVRRGVRRGGVRAAGRRARRTPCPRSPRPIPAPGTRARSRGVRPVVIAVGDVDPERGVGRRWRAPSAAARRAPAVGTLPALDWVGGSRRASRPRAWCPRDKAQAAHRDGVPRSAPAPSGSRRGPGVGGGGERARRAAVRGAARPALAGLHRRGAPPGSRRGRARLVTYIATSPEREEEAREEMLRELERFTREPVSESELRQAVNYLAGPGGGEPAERGRRRGGDPRGVGGGQRPRRPGGSRRRPSGRHRRGRAAGGPGVPRPGPPGRGRRARPRRGPATRGSASVLTAADTTPLDSPVCRPTAAQSVLAVVRVLPGPALWRARG